MGGGRCGAGAGGAFQDLPVCVWGKSCLLGCGEEGEGESYGEANEEGDLDACDGGWGHIHGTECGDVLDVRIDARAATEATLTIGRYGWAFVEHSYAYHITRIDHRHNFSVYSTLLHLRSAIGSGSGIRAEALAFVPQLWLAVLTIPLALSSKDLAGTMLAQTFAFVTFNKVCTSQYFLWYMVFLPLYLPDSIFMKNQGLGLSALVAWVIGQGVWLQQGYQLEFLGESTFVPRLWHATISFFAVNCWILGLIVTDIADRAPAGSVVSSSSKKTN